MDISEQSFKPVEFWDAILRTLFCDRINNRKWYPGCVKNVNVSIEKKWAVP